MTRRIGMAVVILVVLFAAAQLIRPERTSSATDPGHAFRRNRA